MKWLRKRKHDAALVQATEALDKLVREGVITAFTTNFESRKAGEPYRVSVIADPADYLKEPGTRHSGVHR